MQVSAMARHAFSACSAVACSVQLHALSVNVVEAGAKGDGVADDSGPIRQAVTQIATAGGGEIHFPYGTYRMAQGGYGAIHFKGVSNVSIRFAPGAVLLMDNLVQGGEQAGYGGGHGVVITGPARFIRLENVTVRWKVKPAARSLGDAFRFEGFPADDRTLSDIIMDRCQGENSPQTGAVFMGCSDVSVTSFRMIDTLGDGLHFNACRRLNINGVHGINNGDDTLAFVTYYRPGAAISGCYLPEPKIGETFAFDSLNGWCNANSNATNIIAEGGQANGMRISAGLNINVSNLTVRGKAYGGVHIDAAREEDNRARVGWSYLASRGINLSNLVISECHFGFSVRSLNITPDMGPRHWLFGLSVRNLTVNGSSRLGLDIQSSGGVAIDGLVTDSKARFMNARGRYSLANAQISHADLELLGVQGTTFQGFDQRNLEPLPMAVGSADEVAEGDIELSRIAVHSGSLLVQGVAGLVAERVSVDGTMQVSTCRHCDVDRLTVRCEKENEPALSVRKCRDMTFTRTTLGSALASPVLFEDTDEQSRDTLLKELRSIRSAAK